MSKNLVVRKVARRTTYRVLKDNLYTFIRHETDLNVNMQGYADYFQLVGEFAVKHEERFEGEFDPNRAMSQWLLKAADAIRNEDYTRAFFMVWGAYYRVVDWIAYDPFTSRVGDMS